MHIINRVIIINILNCAGIQCIKFEIALYIITAEKTN